MYCEYWNLNKPPFDNVPDSSMYVDCHESMEDVISETIFAIKEGNECFAVIVGDVGLGKTLSLRIIIDSLEPEKYKVALITNPALSFIQLLREIIGQITGTQCQETKKVDLLEIFNRLLFEANDQGKKIVIVIDESNVLSSGNLDDLRLLTNMQDDDRNLFTLILAGQMELAQKLENPKRANLFQRIGTYCHIEKLPSEAAVKTYIESRLKLAGNQKQIFADDAIPVIWEFSEHGVPRLINKICKLCLKAGETNEFKVITGEVASQIADRFQKLSKATSQKRKLQAPPEIEIPKEEISEKPEVKESKKKSRSSTAKKAVSKSKVSSTPVPPTPETIIVETNEFFSKKVLPESIHPQPEAVPVEDEVMPVVEYSATQAPSQPEPTFAETNEAAQKLIPIPVTPQPEVVPFEKKGVPPLRVPSTDISHVQETKSMEPTVVPLACTSSTYVPLPQEANPVGINTKPALESSTTPQENEEQPAKVEAEVYEEVFVCKQKVKMLIPDNIIRQAKLANSDSKNKLAGYWSAQVIKENPHVMHSPAIDPVSIWFEIKNVILSKFNGVSGNN
ncbi:MAG: hypothetical protein APR62_03220 [Smithella sp. SDB]|nr:MAG: hypothetical protein APR62_03220 [Smithella sp. SDB]